MKEIFPSPGHFQEVTEGGRTKTTLGEIQTYEAVSIQHGTSRSRPRAIRTRRLVRGHNERLALRSSATNNRSNAVGPLPSLISWNDRFTRMS